MMCEPLHILQENNLRRITLVALIFYDLGNTEEESASRVFKSFFEAGIAKGLAGKSSTEDIKGGDVV